MKLKEVQCDQFAGLNRNDPASTIKFGDGLNLIVGDNEQGKSTMVLWSLKTKRANAASGRNGRKREESAV